MSGLCRWGGGELIGLMVTVAGCAVYLVALWQATSYCKEG